LQNQYGPIIWQDRENQMVECVLLPALPFSDKAIRIDCGMAGCKKTAIKQMLIMCDDILPCFAA
jgi:hypothetical protein